MLPLVAIATPATYVREPLRVFELDFEANLPIVRAASATASAWFSRRPPRSTACAPTTSSIRRARNLVYGPINKPRWIYACSKQLMDRVIHAYGMEQGLDYTLFRPFNWIGPGLDSIYDAKEGSSRVVTQFLGHIVRGEPIQLVDGGAQKRAFTDIDDGIAALMTIIANPDGIATGKIYNIGNPANNHSVRELAEMMLAMAADYPGVRARAAERGAASSRRRRASTTARGYQDVQNRVPKIDHDHGRAATGGRTVDMDDGAARASSSPIAATWPRRGALTEAADLTPSRWHCIALKVDVDTLRGTREGVPRLLRLLAHRRPARPSCSASGPTTPAGRCGACSGRGSSAKVSRTSVVEHYGAAHAAVRPAAARPGHRPASRRSRCVACARRPRMRHACWDHVLWQDKVRHRATRAWTVRADASSRATGTSSVRRAAATPWRGRLADERGGVPADRSLGPDAMPPTDAAAARSSRSSTAIALAARRSFRPRCRRSTN